MAITPKAAVAAAALAILVAAAASAQPLPTAVAASQDVCAKGELDFEKMKSAASAAGYAALSAAELGELGAGGRGAKSVQGWTKGAGAEQVRVVAYQTEIAGAAHVACVAIPATPAVEDVAKIMTEALGPPGRDAVRGERRVRTWSWENEGRRYTADLINAIDGSRARLVFRTSSN